MTTHYGTTNPSRTACDARSGTVTEDSTKVDCPVCVEICALAVEAVSAVSQKRKIHYCNTQRLIMCTSTLAGKFRHRYTPILGLVTCKNCLHGIERERKRTTCGHPSGYLHGGRYSPPGVTVCGLCGAYVVLFTCPSCVLGGCEACDWVGYHIGPRVPEREPQRVSSL